MAASSAFQFPVGAVAGDTRCINISILDDNIFEGSETFMLSLMVTSGTAIPRGDSTVVTIVENEGKQVITSQVFHLSCWCPL